MADELDEIVPMPDDMGPSSAGLRRNAEWSHQFAASDTSLAQRARGNADKAAYAASLQDRRRQVEMEELKTNKVAQDLYFRNQKMELDKMTAQAALGERSQRFKFQAELHPEILKSRQAQTAASLALEKARNDSALLKSNLETKRANETANFAKSVNGISAKLGTPEFEEELFRARIANPGMESSVFDDVLKASTGRTFTPEEVAARITAMRAAVPQASVTANETGRVSATMAAPKLDRPVVDDSAKRLTHLESLRMKPNVDADVKSYLDAEITKLKGGASPAAPAAAAPADEKVSVISPDGKSGRIPKAQLDAAVKAGYKVK